MKATLALALFFVARIPVQAQRAAFENNVRAGARQHWYSSKKFWLSFAASSAAMAIDYKTSQDLFSRGGHETDPIFGNRRPSPGRMTAIGLPIDFAYSYAGFRMSESKHPLVRKLWWLPSSYSIEEHVRLAVQNTDLCPRGCSLQTSSAFPGLTKGGLLSVPSTTIPEQPSDSMGFRQ